MAPRKTKRQDETRQQPSIGEAIAIGTAAGGLVLGTMQAHATETAAEQAATPTPPLPDSPAPAAQPATPEAHAATPPPTAEAAPAEIAPAPQPAATPLDDAAATIPNTIAAPVQSQLVAELSEQMTATLVKVIGSAEPGQSADQLGQSLATDIVASAQQIVANLDLGSLLAETQNLGDSIIARVDAPQIVADVLGATSGIADSVLTDVGDLPASLLGAFDLGETLADLPSSLLGNEGPDGSGGLLSEIFYADGASDSLAIPDLSQAAGALVTDIGGTATGLLGLSYIDTSDQQTGHGLNALSLL